MRVLILSHMYPSDQNSVYGIFVHKQALALKQQGCEIVVVNPVPWTPFPLPLLRKKWKQYAQITGITTLDGIKVYYPRYFLLPKAILFNFSGAFLYYSIKGLIQKIDAEFDFEIIHAHVALPSGFAGLKIKEKLKKKGLVVTIHGQDLQITVLNKLSLKTMKKVLRNANVIITVSTKLKLLAEKILRIKEKIKVINNGINPIEFCPYLKTDQSPTGLIRSKDIIVLSVSNLYESKGISLNIQAIGKISKKYHNLQYYVIGDGPERSKLERLTRKINLNDKILFLGQLTHSEALRYMTKADIFSLPSWNEGFGIVYLEAMACGKPVIACRGEGIEDVIEDGVTGLLVNPNDLDDLVVKLELLIREPVRARELGMRARELVMEKYTWEENAKNTIAVYKKVLKHAKS